MGSLHTSIPSKNAPVRYTPLTAQSPRRGPRCRLNNPCGRPTKARGLRNDTNTSNARTPHQGTKLPLYYPRLMGCNYNRVHLSTPNRLEIFNRLLISQPYGISSRRYPHPNPMRLYRGPNLNNRPRPDLIRPILLSQY